ncbi:MAG: murein biosynthesis integral membrane protein MurJ [Clostridia bacterium]|nr:murein biosynthesis integral membrane protein MurJ [Clostridia bacterium]
MARKDKLIRTTALVTVVIILSKVFGLLRDVITAGYYGTGIENDAYASAYTLFYLPVLLFNSCITATIVPLFVEEREKHSLDHSNNFASNAVNLFALAALVIAAVMFAFAEPIVKLIFQFDAAGIALTVKMTRIMLLGLVFNIVSIVFSSLLNAMERFMAAQLTGFPLSVAVIASVVFFSGKLGIEAIAWGVFAASVLQMLILIPFLKGWFKYTPVLNFRDKRFHRLLVLAGPAVLSMGVSEINHLIDRSLASGLAAGSISAMNYAYKLITFLLGVLMVPLTTIMFSRMSKQAAANNKEGVLSSLRHSILLISLVALPIVAIAMILSNDVVKMIYMRGSFTMESVLLTGGVLMFYLIGVPSFGMRDFLNRTFHSVQDTKTPFYVSCLVVVLNIILNIILRRFMGARGLALATAISSYIGSAVMFVLLRRHMGHIGLRKILPDMAKIILATGVAAVACFLMNRALPQSSTTITTFLRLAAAAGVSIIAYGAACLALRVEALRAVWSRVARRNK